MSANAVFIVSSGRSGTAMLHKVLSATGEIEMHHEYMVQITQPLGARRFMGLTDGAEARKILAATHGAAICYSNAKYWGDSSNKLSWLIPDLAALLPEAKFVCLVRDGRKVASSYFHKLGGECYDDRSTEILQAHYDDPARVSPPPPEKRYWWPLPRKSDPFAKAFHAFDQFERIAWHWVTINETILESLSTLENDRSIFITLEALRESPCALRGLYDFLNLPYHDDYFAMFARPHNVNRPEDKLLDAKQSAQFERIAGATMRRLGYAAQPEYVVKY